MRYKILKIALPKAENNVHEFEENKWTRFDYPKVLSKIKTVFDWREYPLKILKNSGMTILILSLKVREERFLVYITKT